MTGGGGGVVLCLQKPRSDGYLRGRDASCDDLKAAFLDGGPGRNLVEAAVEGSAESCGAGAPPVNAASCLARTAKKARCLFLRLCSAYSTNLEQV